jgi:hypothetical protein
MPRGKRTNVDVFSLLTADRRNAVIEEALGSHIHTIFSKHSNATLGRLVDALTGDIHWEAIKGVRASTVLRPGNGSGGTGTGARRGRPPGGGKLSPAAVDQILAIVKKKPGLRSEQLQRELSLAPKLVKAGLAQLRKDKRVKTSGQRRSTTYAAA